GDYIMTIIEERLRELNIKLPEAPFPKGEYVPVTIFKNLAFVSGQVPREKNKVLFPGKVDSEVPIKEAAKTAEMCVLKALSYLQEELEDLNRIESVIKINAYIQSSNDFSGHLEVADAASKLLKKILGKKGEHSRTAIGVAELPSNTPVEIDFIFCIK